MGVGTVSDIIVHIPTYSELHLSEIFTTQSLKCTDHLKMQIQCVQYICIY